MSSSNHYIIDTPLPLNQDFAGLKNEGLSFIQEHIGKEWTNFNPSDPGVTILEQVCYALTELGYCNDFEIQDILTDEKGDLDLRDQFYTPAEILTTSPVTINDYRKYLVDGVDGIDNVAIIKAANIFSTVAHAYNTYLLIDSIYNDDAVKEICRAAFIYLNKSRNMGELFHFPKALTRKKFLLTGTVEVADQVNVHTILQQIQDNISNYIFPKVISQGYYSSASSGIPVDDLFNGPLLKKGFILTDSLGTKKDAILSIDLVPLIRQVPGVVSVNGIAFCTIAMSLPAQEISCDVSEVLFPDLATSVKTSLFKITRAGNELNANTAQPDDPLSKWDPVGEVNFVYGNKPGNSSSKIKSVYKNIAAYYSIQNTFPSVYAVGEAGTPGKASAYREAQSRQLKGYLTLMDQVLTNQFSQLANIGRLFSFKNALTGAPSELLKLMQLANPFEKDRHVYPAPFISFSPTYFYQSLYDVPHIRPLLKDNRALDFSYAPAPQNISDEDSWQAYKQDPYNAYMFGLMQIVEDDESNLERRNNILDHLLARHGESPVLIDAYVNGAVYAGISLKDKVICKSLYLQNYAVLSYNRIKAYNYLGAEKLEMYQPGVSGNESDKSNWGAFSLRTGKAIMEDDCAGNSIHSGKINQIEKITDADFINYSSVELKMSLLFGMRALYREFIAENTGKADEEKINQALWLITKRRGCIMIETALLLQAFGLADEGAGIQEKYSAHSMFHHHLVFIFPGYIHLFKTKEFQTRLHLFLQNELPVTISYALYVIDDSLVLKSVIDAFVLWHELIRTDPGVENIQRHRQYAENIAIQLKSAAPVFHF